MTTSALLLLSNASTCLGFMSWDNVFVSRIEIASNKLHILHLACSQENTKEMFFSMCHKFPDLQTEMVPFSEAVSKAPVRNKVFQAIMPRVRWASSSQALMCVSPCVCVTHVFNTIIYHIKHYIYTGSQHIYTLFFSLNLSLFVL